MNIFSKGVNMNFQTSTAAKTQKPARMRTIKACYNLIKQEDPDTSVTINYVKAALVPFSQQIGIYAVPTIPFELFLE